MYILINNGRVSCLKLLGSTSSLLSFDRITDNNFSRFKSNTVSLLGRNPNHVADREGLLRTPVLLRTGQKNSWLSASNSEVRTGLK